MNMTTIQRIACLMLSMVLCGCSAARQERLLEAKNFALAYHEFYAQTLGNVTHETMQARASEYPDLDKAIQSGEFKVHWGALLSDEDSILAYDAKARDSGGLVVYCDARVKYLSAGEFGASTLAEAGALFPKPLKLEKSDLYTKQIGDSILVRVPEGGKPREDGNTGFTWPNEDFLNDGLVIELTNQPYDQMWASAASFIMGKKPSTLQHYAIENDDFRGDLVEFTCSNTQMAESKIYELLLTNGQQCLHMTVAADMRSSRLAELQKCVRTLRWEADRKK